MTKYLALLRGVNVGGRVIKMVDLKACFEKLGLSEVKTFLQTGNVTFDSAADEEGLKASIEKALQTRFGYPAKVQVIALDKITNILRDNPFAGAPSDYHQYIIFFENGLEKDFVAEAAGQDDEQVALGEGVAYWKVQKGKTLKSSRGLLLSKTKYKSFNTNRNVNTLNKIIAK